MKPWTGSLLAAALLLQGCGSKSDANEANFRKAIDEAVDRYRPDCVSIDRQPQEFRLPGGTATLGAFIPPKWPALEAVGLARSEDVLVDEAGPGGLRASKVAVRRYTLTEAAQPFVKDRGMLRWLCGAQRVVDKVVQWDQPARFGDLQLTRVTYTYRMEQVADWAKDPRIQQAQPHIKAAVDGAGKAVKTMPMKLTSLGWEAEPQTYVSW